MYDVLVCLFQQHSFHRRTGKQSLQISIKEKTSNFQWCECDAIKPGAKALYKSKIPDFLLQKFPRKQIMPDKKSIQSTSSGSKAVSLWR